MANRLKMAKIEAILSLHQRNWSIRRIAKELGLHRDTVARYVQLHEAEAKPASAEAGAPGGEKGGEKVSGPFIGLCSPFR